MGSQKMNERTEVRGVQIEWLGHSTVGLYGQRKVYIDPFSEIMRGKGRYADIIISTHGHRDHFDVEAINGLSKTDTQIIVKGGTDVSGLAARSVKTIEVGETVDLGGLEIRAVHAYNTKRFRSPGTPFHPRGFGMGVLLRMQGVMFYYTGDTDFVEEMKRLRKEEIDVAFLPIGGTYTMDVDEAVEAATEIHPKIVIPVHYNYIKGTETDPQEFKKRVEAIDGFSVMVLQPAYGLS